mmetsp:Transcript_74188/g.169970  ORF Transcript_74188/g.169970 Transcript_74188/m.169970 type:complete len:310 (+) Transcript_74188:398-1327(+)
MQNGEDAVEWDAVEAMWKAGCSLQAVRPQRYSTVVHTFVEAFEDVFHCLAGSNSFMTPTSSQGFKPHYDEVEVFMLQIEGRKRWRLYRDNSRGPLPLRGMCWDIKEQGLELLLDTWVEAGDMLYLPRGTIHQGVASDDGPSHHLTISTYQRFAWVDFLSKGFSEALERAAADDVRFRAGLPLHLLETAGVAPSSDGVGKIREKVRELLGPLGDHFDVSAAADAMAAQFVARRLPPSISVADAEYHKGVSVRWANPSGVRVIVETLATGSETQIYHCGDNDATAHQGTEDPTPECVVLEGTYYLSALQVL